MTKIKSNSTSKNSEVIDIDDLKNFDFKSLVNHFEFLLADENWKNRIKKIQELVTIFEHKYKNESLLMKSKHIKKVGNEIDFTFNPEYKIKFDQISKDFKFRKKILYKERENTQKTNLEKKLKIIEDLKGLINVDQNINSIYKRFRTLQDSWHKTGSIPNSQNLNVWNTYKHHVEIFYDFLHLNRELREIDFKHNLHEKIKIIEKAETLADSTDIIKASRDLNSLHRLWKNELGPVAKEHNEGLWKRFQKASKLIHLKRQEYNKNYESILKENYQKKLILIKRFEEIKESSPSEYRDWQKILSEHNQLRIEFKKISPLKKKESKETWNKFRIINKEINRNKNSFFKKQKSIQKNNINDKKVLIDKVKIILKKEKWSEHIEEIKLIQKEWNKIGFVSKNISQKLWSEFNSSCNLFFERLKKGYKKISLEEEKILKKKDEFISSLDKEKIPGEIEELNKFIHDKWENFNSIGNLKSNAYMISFTNFSTALNKLIGGLKLKKSDNETVKFNIKILGIEKDPKKIKNEVQLLKRKIEDINSKVLQLENNIDFFSDSSSKNPLIKDVLEKISDHKNESIFLDNCLSRLKSIERKIKKNLEPKKINSEDN
tara:strand:- start:1575 stop:3386 length:1812 start_codon:yes stop_codon:yes gene_type:complete